jgi:hypothetical protein
MIFGPVGCGLLLSYFTRRIPEPELPALVRLHSMWITPGGNKDDPRMVPCVTIKNPTQESWRNLSVGLNEQFYCSDPKELRAGEVLSLPLEVFIARNGSVRFPVGNREIKLVTVFAQISSGARAVSEHNMQGRSTIRRESEAEEIWVNGVRKARKIKTDGHP